MKQVSHMYCMYVLSDGAVYLQYCKTGFASHVTEIMIFKPAPSEQWGIFPNFKPAP